MLKFSAKKKIAKVTFTGTHILLYIHDTNTIIIILLLYYYYNFNKYLYYWKVVNSIIHQVSPVVSQTKNYSNGTLINIILLNIHDTNTQAPTIHSNFFFNKKNFNRSFISFLAQNLTIHYHYYHYISIQWIHLTKTCSIT